MLWNRIADSSFNTRMESTNTKLSECCVGKNGFTVDTESGVIRGVKVIGCKSINNRRYPAETLAKAIPMYEGIGVYADHPGRNEQNADRSFDRKFAWLQSVKQDADGGLSGDLHYLTTDPRGPKLAESAARRPDLFGLSHNAEGKTKMQDGTLVITEITKVNSVDVVTDPATTQTLFESEAIVETVTPVTEAFETDVSAVIADESADTAGRIAKVMEICKSYSKSDEKPAMESVAQDLQAKLDAITESLSKLTESVGKLQEFQATPAPKAKPVVGSARLNESVQNYPSSSEAIAQMKSRK